MKAGYIASFFVVQDVVWFVSENIHRRYVRSPASDESIHHQRLKHIDITFYWPREQLVNKNIILVCVSTDD